MLRPILSPTAMFTPLSRRFGPDVRRPDLGLVGLFTVTLFVSAGLLFGVQPMVARMALPALGGSPAVWNTCTVFFQSALLAGYAYAHFLAGRAGVRAQATVHAVVVLLPMCVLPIGLGELAPPSGGSPVPWLLWTLLTAVGLPFFVVAATAPLLQRWFGATGHPSAADPYFLYAASNLGSMAALLGYPLLVEPSLGLAWQGRAWGLGYVGLAALVVACGVSAARRQGANPVEAGQPEHGTRDQAVGQARWWRWVGLAFVPSSLMLGVTSYLSTDIAAVPLLWVVPLALYLLTFIVVFSRRAAISREMAATLMPPAVLLLAWTLAVGAEPTVSLMALHLATYFLVALVCHGRLASDRPSPRRLTAFYLAMSFGGVLGGLFNALLAPLLFDRIVEYPLVLGLSCLALPRLGGAMPIRKHTALLVVLAAAFLSMIGGRLLDAEWPIAGWLTRPAGGVVAILGLVGFVRRPLGLTLICLALLLTGFLPDASDGRVLWRGRDFFGVLTVTENDHGRDHRLVHGRTLHGRQNLDPATRDEPLTYYTRTGPVGDLFRALEGRDDGGHVAVVGLGAGSMASYARPSEAWTFYEIDPAVAKVARDPKFFTFLLDSPAKSVDVLLGDARLRLREAPDGASRLIVLDAFSSDAIPVHLLTREALALYRAKIAKDGLIAFHISNRYVDLGPVLARLAADAGLRCRVRSDLAVTRAEADGGKTPSIWAVMAANDRSLGPLAADPRWVTPASKPGDPVWADDFSDLVPRLVGLR